MRISLFKAQTTLKTCDEHENEQLSCFCETCDKFMCTECTNQTHRGHDWDLVFRVARKRRKEFPLWCREIRKENMPQWPEKLRVIDANISVVEKASDEDVEELEERRLEVIKTINQIIDEQKKERKQYKTKKIGFLKEQRRHLRTKITYLNKMTSGLTNNTVAYTDYDVIELEHNMRTALRQVESHDVNIAVNNLKFWPGKKNLGHFCEIIDTLEEKKIIFQGSANVEELKTFKYFSNFIYTIKPISSSEAWICDGEGNVTIVCLNSNETQSKALQSFTDYVVSTYGDCIVTDYSNQAIRLVSSTGEESSIVSTMPLHPTFISKTPSGAILITLIDHEDEYNSRHLVQRMTRTGDILHTYEFRKNAIAKLFTFPTRTAENGKL